MQITQCYQFRLRPTQEQAALFRQFSGFRRYVWNWALSTFGETFTYPTAALALTQFKKTQEGSFLKGAVAQSLQQVLRDLEQAFKNRREGRAGWPRFKSRHTTPNAFRFPQSVRLEGNAVLLPKIGSVPLILHRRVEGELKSATLKQTPSGKWNIIFVCHTERESRPVTCENAVGLDVGLETFVTTSEGEKVEPPQFFRKQQTRIRRAQRRVSRKQKSSKNRTRARQRLSAVHEKVRNQRSNFLHQLTHRLASAYDVLCLEDLNLSALAKSKLRGHSKSWWDAAHGEFRRQLEYKCLWRSKRILRVDRYYPSSQICSECRHRVALCLSDRSWVCPCCKTQHDRDENAAKNLKREGLRILSAGMAAVMPVEEDVRLAKQAVPVETGKVLHLKESEATCL
jgi:putative transposase